MKPGDLERIYQDFNDDEIFARESLVVLHKNGNLVPMLHGPAQRKLSESIRRDILAGKPVRTVFLKARQVWGTVFVASHFFKRVISRSGHHCMVLAHDDKSAKNIFDHYRRFYDNYKPFRGIIALPRLTSDRADSLEFDNGSWIKIHTASNAKIGRSFTLHSVHFSEAGFYGDNARALMGSIMGAVPDTPDTEVLVESSPNGLGNEFHIMWQRAITGESEWRAEYFAWWEHPEYRRPLDIPADRFEASVTLVEREIRSLYNLSLEQLNWRRWKIRNDLNGDEDLFRQEFSSNPEECWLSSGRPRFDLKQIAKQPVIRDAMEGRLEMQDLGGQKRLIFNQIDRGELVIYRKPQENRQYIIGADTAEGIDRNEGKGKAEPDWSVAQVFDRDTGEQVARLRARYQPAEFGYQLFLLGVYYCWAQQVPEIWPGPGLATVDSLLTHGYPPSLIYHRIQTPSQDPSERSDLMGFKTTTVSRPQLISGIDEALRSLSIVVHDPITINELRTFVIKPSGKAEHRYGQHDDTVIAVGLVIVGMQEMPRKKKVGLTPREHSQVENYRRRSDHMNTDQRGNRLRIL